MRTEEKTRAGWRRYLACEEEIMSERIHKDGGRVNKFFAITVEMQKRYQIVVEDEDEAREMLKAILEHGEKDVVKDSAKIIKIETEDVAIIRPS